MQLPFAPKPIATELVSSWLLRVAAANFVSLCELLRGLQSRYDRIPPYWPIDYCLSDVAMTSLSKFCRVPSQEIRRLDLRCRAPHLHPGLLLHFPNGSSIDPRCASQRVRYSFCRCAFRRSRFLCGGTGVSPTRFVVGFREPRSATAAVAVVISIRWFSQHLIWPLITVAELAVAL